MKVITLLRTTAQLKGMLDEVKAKRKLLKDKLEKGGITTRDVEKLEHDIDTVEFGFDLVDKFAMS